MVPSWRLQSGGGSYVSFIKSRVRWRSLYLKFTGKLAKYLPDPTLNSTSLLVGCIFCMFIHDLRHSIASVVSPCSLLRGSEILPLLPLASASRLPSQRIFALPPCVVLVLLPHAELLIATLHKSIPIPDRPTGCDTPPVRGYWVRHICLYGKGSQLWDGHYG
jgi:hypothetical protein